MGAPGTGILQPVSILLFLGLGMQAQAMTTVTAMVGDTITLKCEANRNNKITLVSWRMKLSDAGIEQLISLTPATDIITNKEVPGYKDRITMNEDFSLSISNVGIQDEKIFSCFTLVESDIDEVSVSLKVYKIPSIPKILEPVAFLEEGNLQQVGVCVVNNSYPAANITWQYNFQNLDANNPAVKIKRNTVRNEKDYYNTRSSLKYMSKKGEGEVSFTCTATYFEDPNNIASKTSSPLTVLVHYKTSKVLLQVTPAQDVEEGTNVTLTCVGDGYPPPDKFIFMKNGEEKEVNTMEYELINVSREDTGEYSCTQQDNPDIKDAVNITVHYLTLTMNPDEDVTKMVGENITVECIAESSGTEDVTLMKRNKGCANPFITESLQYTHSGTYTCSAKIKEVKEMKREKTVNVRVEGKPRINKLTKKVVNNAKVISCVVEGFPQPTVQWSINGTAPREEPVKDKKSQWNHRITVKPSENITVTCTAINSHGEDQDTVNLTAMRFKEPLDETLEQDPSDPNNKNDNSKGNGDQAKVIVGVIVGLLLAAVIAGVAYWLYKKKSPTSKTKTNERGTADEIKKINKGDNNHTTAGSSAV
ncbi:CD166 antigen homolog A isoform X2 [Scyliorhinus canicula]|uniref:CD166 antigen homolog A isoform X2 n=1 Tax=Scyliorhinus canicula TaxID=7830 RepID=UPI0018F414E1|nr:CD166 antigen homolog A isoform X2 [Scyliorhinus canicula]